MINIFLQNFDKTPVLTIIISIILFYVTIRILAKIYFLLEKKDPRYRKRRWGDRKDGFLVRSKDPFFRIIPYVMPTRVDAQVFFEDSVDILNAHTFVRQLRKEGYKASLLHVYILSMVRMISQRPKVNRFVVGKKTYARRDITFSLAIKNSMDLDAAEATVKLSFDPDVTIYDVIEKVNKVISENKGSETSNDTDVIARVFNALPSWLLNGVVAIIKGLDYIGLLPKFLVDASPFHSSFFVTDLGSLGIKGAYHHIYNFGTLSLFMAIGHKEKSFNVNRDETVQMNRSMTIKFVIDERIVDGYYFASSLKLVKDYVERPEQLKSKPKQIYIDDEV
jgi:hypothetical protein